MNQKITLSFSVSKVGLTYIVINNKLQLEILLSKFFLSVKTSYNNDIV